jgi:hypothetical protein
MQAIARMLSRSTGHQRLEMPVAILEAMARSARDQLHDEQRHHRRHDVDEAVHAIEDDGLRTRDESARDA